MKNLKAKKFLGQHFLNDLDIARKTVELLKPEGRYTKVIEVGPGMGVLSKILIEKDTIDLYVIDIDTDSIQYLKKDGILSEDRIIEADFLQLDLNKYVNAENFAIIGNFPYNISTQILFKAYEYRDQVQELVGMFQKEVAERIASGPGNKTYGILSVLLQAFFDINYEFTVNEDVFTPAPKVKSAVISLRRNDTKKLNCDEKLFKRVIKLSFNQRRKTLRNSLKSILTEDIREEEILNKRPEQLHYTEFVDLTNMIFKNTN